MLVHTVMCLCLLPFSSFLLLWLDFYFMSSLFLMALLTFSLPRCLDNSSLRIQPFNNKTSDPASFNTLHNSTKSGFCACSELHDIQSCTWHISLNKVCCTWHTVNSQWSQITTCNGSWNSCGESILKRTLSSVCRIAQCRKLFILILSLQTVIYNGDFTDRHLLDTGMFSLAKEVAGSHTTQPVYQSSWPKGTLWSNLLKNFVIKPTLELCDQTYSKALWSNRLKNFLVKPTLKLCDQT